MTPFCPLFWGKTGGAVPRITDVKLGTSAGASEKCLIINQQSKRTTQFSPPDSSV
jgi:hypothetical protein